MNIIDELGMLNQTIAKLEESARKLKAEIIARGAGKYDGTLFYAEVKQYDRSVIKANLVREILDPELLPSVTEIQHVEAVVVKSLGE